MSQHVVIDQNVFRKEAVLRPAIEDARTHGDCILVTDMALAEMMKASEWESTTRRSLQILAEDPAVVVVGRALGPMMKEEFETGQPCSELVDAEVTTRFRDLLVEVRSQQDGAVFDHVRTVIGDARALAAEQHFGHARNKESLTKVVSAWKAALTADELKAVRQNNNGEAVQSILESGSMQVTCFQALAGADYPAEKAASLTMQASLTAHEFFAYVALGLRWIDGIEGADPKKITNDLADKDYVVIASFCRRLISEEGRVNELHDRLVRMAAARAKVFAQVAASVP